MLQSLLHSNLFNIVFASSAHVQFIRSAAPFESQVCADVVMPVDLFCVILPHLKTSFKELSVSNLFIVASASLSTQLKILKICCAASLCSLSICMLSYRWMVVVYERKYLFLHSVSIYTQ